MAQQTTEVVPATQAAPQDKWANFETSFTNAKAGMSGVNKDHVKRIVYEMSKVCTANAPQQIAKNTNIDCGVFQDSPHFKNEQRKQAQTEARIQKLRTKAKAFTQAELAASCK